MPALVRPTSPNGSRFHTLTIAMNITAAKADPIPKATYIDSEPEFRWALLADQMAFDKLHEGIVKFAADAVTLKEILKKKIAA
jgi:transaldolase